MTGDPLLSKFRVSSLLITKYYNAYPGDPIIHGQVTPTYTSKERYYLPFISLSGLGIPAPATYTSDAYRMDGTTYMGMNIQGRTITIQIPVLGDVTAKKAEIYELFSQDPKVSQYTYFDLCLALDVSYMLILRDITLQGVTEVKTSPVGYILTIVISCTDPMFYARTIRRYSASFACSIYGPPTNMLSSHNIEPYGTWVAYPRIAIIGSCQNFSIENKSNGKKLELNVTTSLAEVVTIVTQPGPYQCIVSNISRTSIGYNLISLVEGGSVDFCLNPIYGINDIEISGYNMDTGTTTISIEWEDVYVGV